MKFIIFLFLFSPDLCFGAVTSIKDNSASNFMAVNADGSINVDTVGGVSPINPTGSMSSNTSITNGAVVTFTAPTNALGFILEASSANTSSLRWGSGNNPTTSTGLILEPGRDTGFVPLGASVGVIAINSGSQEADIQWVLNK